MHHLVIDHLPGLVATVKNHGKSELTEFLENFDAFALRILRAMGGNTKHCRPSFLRDTSHIRKPLRKGLVAAWRDST